MTDAENSKLDAFIGTLVSMASGGKDFVLRKVVDDIIFPWYEANTGKHNSNRVMRKQVAAKIEQSLSLTRWITKEDARELSDTGIDGILTPDLFLVGHVYPQSLANGHYDVMVSVYQKGTQDEALVVSLETFMREFVPYDELNFFDLDS